MPSTKSQPPFEVDSATLARLKDERVRDQLVQSLLDGTVHSIVDSLKDLQSIQEQRLWAQREDKIAMVKREGASDEDERLTYDNGTILERIDEIVREQQSTLICAGLPLFKSSDDACDLRVQMALIQFILSLGPIYKE
uniref:BAG domain-containing protein n=2 Tax=Globodera pallida TaxID=36090 RepID=A0A183BY29_GLOPA